MVLAKICYPPYTKEKGEQYESPKGKRSLPKPIVNKSEIFLLLSVRSLQFFIFLDAFLSILQIVESKASFATPVRAGGTTALARTGGRYFLWKLFFVFLPTSFLSTGEWYIHTCPYGWSLFAQYFSCVFFRLIKKRGNFTASQSR